MRVLLTMLMLLVSVACLTLAPPTPARADVMTIVEDFEDENGGPGFDPRFSHEFLGTPGHEPRWQLGPNATPPQTGYGLAVIGTDVIRFLLASNERVIFASVDYNCTDWPAGLCYIEFIGLQDTLKTPLVMTSPYVTVAASSAQIGDITQIRLTGIGEARFDNIALHVVPEPCHLALGLLGLLTCWIMRRFGGARRSR